MNWIQDMIVRLFKIIPAKDKEITITEAYTFQQNIQKNRIWYHGEPAELDQFFKKTLRWETDRSRFWAASPNGQVRKIHSGIVSMVVDRYKDIIMADMDSMDFDEGKEAAPIKDLWELIAEDNQFLDLLGEAVQMVLALGDGAFKIFTDEVSKYPVIQFYDMDNVAFNTRYGRLIEIKYYTNYVKGNETFRLEETYGKGYIKYKLYDSRRKECPLDKVEETKGLEDTQFNGDFIMGVPLCVFKSGKWKGRGKALFDTKSDVLDALDEVISQWLDAVRLGRIKRYIPKELIPRNPETGELMAANPFDNDFIAIGSSFNEGRATTIDVSQPQITYEAYLNSYSNFLDMVLQGIMSPSTLGIDLKKTDNADSQREKEKITMHVRGKIVDALTIAIPQTMDVTMKVYDLMHGKTPGEYNASVSFGEYASPDFNSTVDTVSKARNAQVMSIEKSIDELYGDTMSDEDKELEVRRLKAEQGIAEVEEPAVNTEGVLTDESKGNEPPVPDGTDGI